MTAFAYNDSMHSNINYALNKLFKNYITNFVNESEKQIHKEKNIFNY